MRKYDDQKAKKKKKKNEKEIKNFLIFACENKRARFSLLWICPSNILFTAYRTKLCLHFRRLFYRLKKEEKTSSRLSLQK